MRLPAPTCFYLAIIPTGSKHCLDKWLLVLHQAVKGFFLTCVKPTLTCLEKKRVFTDTVLN